ncbi:hypothetical protein [Peterkaempfera bronchialis]|uniref:hypothetical protein n=1 Tax=Peterkaempfera bronchialis TaxID=2126346 RepID=UPI0013B3CAF3|nr:hypothetical protein [Peterkaempfera bronchialis]
MDTDPASSQVGKLEAACHAVGLDASGATVLRGHTNAVFLLASSPVVVKIARRGSNTAEVRRTVQLVEWLVGLDFPTVPLLPREQPVLVVDCPWAPLTRPVAVGEIAVCRPG